MNRLFRAPAFRSHCSNVRFEEQGINLFAECIRRAEQATSVSPSLSAWMLWACQAASRAARGAMRRRWRWYEGLATGSLKKACMTWGSGSSRGGSGRGKGVMPPGAGPTWGVGPALAQMDHLMYYLPVNAERPTRCAQGRLYD
jgi:hypothetical protein